MPSALLTLQRQPEVAGNLRRAATDISLRMMDAGQSQVMPSALLTLQRQPEVAGNVRRAAIDISLRMMDAGQRELRYLRTAA
jgi:uncharacterized protein (UPF0147 family)